ncbi:thymidine phosphorylase family protein [Oceanimonas sp. GK1]|uniref:thymidine phosphorylase family protein n=1 Tax=Oceanimonas sp. (strain GK1 / IBRC-M 10197) TaxID=511062 RepID=UPI0005A157A8|nr:thymidine phosphorylase family protein [Oceanimonas sp. GK1]
MPAVHSLLATAMGIDTHQEPVVFLRADSEVCRAEGFIANTRIQVTVGEHSLIATLNVVTNEVLPARHIGFSRIAWERLALLGDEEVSVRHAPVLHSMSAVRKKMYGNTLSKREMNDIIADISQHRYSDMQIAAFLTACVERLDTDEVIALTQSMVDSGKRLSWPTRLQLVDKHCIGGLPGNRTTPIVVAIASAAGLIMAKTSSRAITSPAGTADTMEVLTRVHLDLAEIQATVRKVNACLVWGGAVNLSPADDMLIRIERALDIDGTGQMVASVLSKKIAAGSTHVLIDIPVGPTAKVRSQPDAEAMSRLFETVGQALRLKVRCLITDGSEAIGYGLGPAQEARDVLAVLQNQPEAPADLRERALLLAAHLLNMAGKGELDDTSRQARELLESGQAWHQFRRICEAQGGLKPIPEAACSLQQGARHSGTLLAMDNRRLSRLAKLAGAPNSPAAGLRLHAKLGQALAMGQPLFTLYADSQGELDYAADYYEHNHDLFMIGEAP